MNATHLNATGRLLPELEYWPEADRIAWQKATSRGRGPFHRGYRPNSPYSIRKLRGGYARWLRYLDDAGELDPTQPLQERVTPERLDRYFDHLRSRGNADYTVVCRFEELRDTLRMLCPDADFRWVAKPGGHSIRHWLPMHARVVSPIDSDILLDWAEMLFAEGLASPVRRQRCTMVRDAAIIGLLTERAPRRRALSNLQLQDSLKRTEKGWMLNQNRKLTKTGMALFMPVSERVGRMLDRYVAIEREELLGSLAGQFVWARFGGPLTQHGLAEAVKKRSCQHFGAQFGPHFFRHCLATKITGDLSSHPFDAATLLGHASPKTTLKSYVHATIAATAKRHSELLDRLRQ